MGSGRWQFRMVIDAKWGESRSYSREKGGFCVFFPFFRPKIERKYRQEYD